MTSFSLPAYPDINLPSGEPLDRSSYIETTAGDSIALTAREWRVPEGLVLESSDSRGDRHIVIVNDTLETQAWQFRSERDQTRLDVKRNGAGVSIRGTVAGEPVERETDLPEPLWIQSIERSLRRFVVDGEAGDRIRFAVVQPDTLSARTLEARIMGDERISVAGETVTARRVRISLPGIGAIIWRSNYWFRLPDGLFVQSRVTRGPPGTPETLVSLDADGG
jgi:hypothetical protein